MGTFYSRQHSRRKSSLRRSVSASNSNNTFKINSRSTRSSLYDRFQLDGRNDDARTSSTVWNNSDQPSVLQRSSSFSNLRKEIQQSYKTNSDNFQTAQQLGYDVIRDVAPTVSKNHISALPSTSKSIPPSQSLPHNVFEFNNETLESIHVGMTLCEMSLQVGTFDPTIKTVEGSKIWIHLEDLPELSLFPKGELYSDMNSGKDFEVDQCARTPKNSSLAAPSSSLIADHKIVIGWDAVSFSLNRINLCRLILQESTVHHFTFPTGQESFQTEEVIRMFLKKIISLVQEKVRGKALGSLVIATESVASSMAKERLKRLGVALGFSSVQILSTILAAGIAHIHKNFTNLNHPRLVMIQYFKSTFSMVVLEVTSKSVASIAVSCSEEIPECQGEMFKKLHAHLAGGGMLAPAQLSIVLRAYKISFSNLQKEVDTPITNVICVSNIRTKIDGLISKFVHVDRLKIENPSLHGACILAARKLIYKTEKNIINGQLRPNSKSSCGKIT